MSARSARTTGSRRNLPSALTGLAIQTGKLLHLHNFGATRRGVGKAGGRRGIRGRGRSGLAVTRARGKRLRRPPSTNTFLALPVNFILLQHLPRSHWVTNSRKLALRLVQKLRPAHLG